MEVGGGTCWLNILPSYLLLHPLGYSFAVNILSSCKWGNPTAHLLFLIARREMIRQNSRRARHAQRCGVTALFSIPKS